MVIKIYTPEILYKKIKDMDNKYIIHNIKHFFSKFEK